MAKDNEGKKHESGESPSVEQVEDMHDLATPHTTKGQRSAQLKKLWEPDHKSKGPKQVSKK